MYILTRPKICQYNIEYSHFAGIFIIKTTSPFNVNEIEMKQMKHIFRILSVRQFNVSVQVRYESDYLKRSFTAFPTENMYKS